MTKTKEKITQAAIISEITSIKNLLEKEFCYNEVNSVVLGNLSNIFNNNQLYDFTYLLDILNVAVNEVIFAYGDDAFDSEYIKYLKRFRNYAKDSNLNKRGRK